VYFPSPHKFNPDRWLSPEVSLLENRFMPFSKGPRSCIGINLAYAELYLNLGHMVRWYDLELFETSESAMKWKDNFVPTTQGHLKVKVGKAQ
jgi:cytochrome P450